MTGAVEVVSVLSIGSRWKRGQCHPHITFPPDCRTIAKSATNILVHCRTTINYVSTGVQEWIHIYRAEIRALATSQQWDNLPPPLLLLPPRCPPWRRLFVHLELILLTLLKYIWERIFGVKDDAQRPPLLWLDWCRWGRDKKIGRRPRYIRLHSREPHSRLLKVEK